MNFKINELISKLTQGLPFVWQSGPGWSLASIALLIIQGGLRVLALYVMKLVIDAITATISNPAGIEKGFAHICWLIVFEGMVCLSLAISEVVSNWVSDIQVEIVTDHMHDLIHTKAIEIDLEYYENPKYHDILFRCRKEASFRPTKIFRDLLKVGKNGVSLLAMSSLLFYFHWAIALILFVNVIPGIIIRLKYSNILFKWQHERVPTERKVWYFHWILTGDSFAKEIRLFDLGRNFIDKYNNVREQLRKERREITSKRAFAEGVSQLSAKISIFGSYIFIAFRVVHGIISMGDLLLFYQTFQRGQRFLHDMLAGLADLYEDNLFLTDMFKFLSLERKAQEPNHPKPVPRPVRKGIVFDRVCFQYPNESNRVALNDINIAISPGEKIALVGENGSGKTTLIKLLCRLYDPTTGSITIDGIGLHEFSKKDLQREFSVIFQDFSRYNLTARENIALGNIGQFSNLEQVKEAAYSSGIDRTISELNQGYDTVLGKLFDDGEELSIGEWQKVALARAFYRNSQFIVMDEPTSAMDAEAEYKLFKKIYKILDGRTVVLISHRFSTIHMADSIYVLDKGRIIECGSHQELISCGGKYARMFEKQAGVYQSGIISINNLIPAIQRKDDQTYTSVMSHL